MTRRVENLWGQGKEKHTGIQNQMAIWHKTRALIKSFGVIDLKKVKRWMLICKNPYVNNKSNKLTIHSKCIF